MISANSTKTQERKGDHVTMTTNSDNSTQVAVQRAAPAKRRALAAMADDFQIEPERLLQVLKATVIRPTERYVPSDEEVVAFILVANQYKLNPFTREIHAFASSEKGIVPIVGVDGWAKIVNEHDRFNGCEFEEIEDEETGKPLKTTCTMHVKDRDHPVKITERYVECKRNSPPWNMMPFRMLRHKAFMQASRIAFSISGIYDEDEARDIIHNAQLERQQDPMQAAAEQTTKTSAVAQRLRENLDQKTQPALIEQPEPSSGEREQTPAPPAASEEPAEPARPAPQKQTQQQPQLGQPAGDPRTYAELKQAISSLALDRDLGLSAADRALKSCLLGAGKIGKEAKLTPEEIAAWWSAAQEGRGHFASFAGAKS